MECSRGAQLMHRPVSNKRPHSMAGFALSLPSKQPCKTSATCRTWRQRRGRTMRATCWTRRPGRRSRRPTAAPCTRASQSASCMVCPFSACFNCCTEVHLPGNVQHLSAVWSDVCYIAHCQWKVTQPICTLPPDYVTPAAEADDTVAADSASAVAKARSGATGSNRKRRGRRRTAAMLPADSGPAALSGTVCLAPA
jgi:hypothetical protein